MKQWSESRLKNLLAIPLSYGLNVSSEDDREDWPRYIRITDFDDFDHLNEGTFKSLPISVAEPALLKDGDLLFARCGATAGKTFLYSALPKGACYAGYLIRARFKRNLVNPRFVSYFTKGVDYCNWKNRYCIQTTIQNISADKYNQLPISIPSLSEQQRIVDYLDEKLAKIDERIEVLEKQQDAYARLKKSVIHQAVTRGLDPDVRLKDSGIEWIGMIPEHWERFRLKDLGYMYSGLTGKSGDDFRCDDETKTKPYVPFTNVLNNTIVDNENFHYVVMEDNEQQNQVNANDLLFLMSSEDYESIAKSAVVVGNPGEVYLNSFCRGLRITNKKCYAPFINYQLNSEVYRDALRFEARGFTRINIKIDRVASQFVSIPPLSEQQAIASYLDEKCAKIDAAIENIGKQIDASKRLKRALINEVITGQRAV